ncbi:hypothetical protein JDV02_003131 [Purpureocillium takamizusanense]|uniref:Uncharacterized protein n=1 Tax=Purpureocillium takamizusanense TaxID=2060973 RepID=A0A9Q8QAY7_9HYPO|nr:uncharacterized protein JDV02_003131 [Purpureocillium takamizusanense]UNI16718.1 hypothetical protein JDV02_003131 [Purpureocillium takamizusanense]
MMASATPANADSQVPLTVIDQPQPSPQSPQSPQSQLTPIVDGPVSPVPTAPAGPEPRVSSSQVDTSLREFLRRVDGYAPICISLMRLHTTI